MSKMTRSVCLFAHYDPTPDIAPHVVHYLKQLTLCGLDIHLAFSGHDSVPAHVQKLCDELGIKIYPRPNRGMDFGAWQYLIQQGCLEKAETILFTNDSIFGPFYPLQPLFSTMQNLGRDIWGMVESYEMTWHLQSWFLCFKRKAFDHPTIQRVFTLPFHEMSKAEIIHHGELGLGVAIQAAGLTCASCWYANRRGLRKIISLNPMIINWLSVIKSHYVPFIKVELIRDNPVQLFWHYRWRKIVASYAPFFNPQWVDLYLKKRGSKPLPPKVNLFRIIYFLLLCRNKGTIIQALFHTLLQRK
ncbi:rhamnan synthesis F family protein [Entomobacter blattae]|uniref:Rhamnan synthesis protein F n=1 Tax=Entomobacter blattae TaxID=2762277 RepID=A0A7H1NQ82_9PROT|nr:rhamnan synthesis F family protein [Entomobacter blattae]QNT77942.1 Rhamnan synthesis protein F [Entomobacter blattae]